MRGNVLDGFASGGLWGGGFVSETRKYYPIARLREDVHQALLLSGDFSPTAIRCVANDMLDAMSRDGWKVHWDYDRELLVKQVRRMGGVA